MIQNAAAALAASALAAAANAAIVEEERTRPRVIAYNQEIDRLKNAYDLNINKSVVIWSAACLHYNQHLTIEQRFVTQYQALLAVINLNAEDQEFYDRMSQPGGIAATANPQFNFWLQYGWLACSFAIRDDYDLDIVMVPPHTWEGSNKHYWWSTHLVGSPFYIAIDLPLTKAENMVTAFEDQHRNATTAAAVAVAASQEAERVAAESAYT